MQKIYYRSIAWIIPISWIFCLWVMIAFIVGGTQLYGTLGHDLAYGFLMWVMVVGMEALAWFLAPRVVKYYRWEQ